MEWVENGKTHDVTDCERYYNNCKYYAQIWIIFQFLYGIMEPGVLKSQLMKYSKYGSLNNAGHCFANKGIPFRFGFENF